MLFRTIRFAQIFALIFTIISCDNSCPYDSLEENNNSHLYELPNNFRYFNEMDSVIFNNGEFDLPPLEITKNLFRIGKYEFFECENEEEHVTYWNSNLNYSFSLKSSWINLRIEFDVVESGMDNEFYFVEVNLSSAEYLQNQDKFTLLYDSGTDSISYNSYAVIFHDSISLNNTIYSNVFETMASSSQQSNIKFFFNRFLGIVGFELINENLIFNYIN